MSLTLTLAALPLIAATGVSLGVAFAAAVAGAGGRRVVLAILALPIFLFSPVAVVAGVLEFFGTRLDNVLADAALARLLIVGVVVLGLVGPICGLAIPAYLAALRAPAANTVSPRPRWGSAVWVVVTVAVLSVLAVVVQIWYSPFARVMSFSDLVALTAGNSRLAVGVPQLLLLLVVALLGVAAVVVVIVTGTHITVTTQDDPESVGTGQAAVLAACSGAVLVVAVTVFGLLPYLLERGGENFLPVRQAVVYTWLPPLTTAAVGLPTAWAAAFGIGAVRPLGRHSEWLLLLFAPWVFLGLGPILAGSLEQASTSLLRSAFLVIVTPAWINIPALVVLTVFFRGTAIAGWARRPALLASWPLVVGVGLVSLWFLVQDVTWSAATFDDQGYAGGPQWVLLFAAGVGDSLAPALPLVAVALLWIALAHVGRTASGPPRHPNQAHDGRAMMILMAAFAAYHGIGDLIENRPDQADSEVHR